MSVLYLVEYVSVVVVVVLIQGRKVKMDIKSEPEDSDGEEIPPACTVETLPTDSRNLLPEKSQAKYDAIYTMFMKWKDNQKAKSFSENILLEYFTELSQKYQPSTLWSHYSMLKSTLRVNNDVDISSYEKLSEFLKKKNSGFQCKKSKVLTSDDLTRFLNEASDHKHLGTKVISILGVMGACKREELCNLTVDDMVDLGSMFLIKIPNTKTNHSGPFTIGGEFYNVIKKYSDLRPPDTHHKKFLLNYQNGKCTNQVVGVNKIGATPKKIATFLNLPNPESYTGHSLRRTSTLITDFRADISILKRLGVQKSNTVEESYSAGPNNNKKRRSTTLTESICSEATSAITQEETGIDNMSDPLAVSNENVVVNNKNMMSQDVIVTGHTINITFNNCSNVTIVCNEAKKN